ncbi:MAG: hypothetical protein Q8P05_06325 [Candidatus Diapherotrites archaeon]|nr:hypothetical protein [Candidatus Diapherotrites archaeon]
MSWVPVPDDHPGLAIPMIRNSLDCTQESGLVLTIPILSYRGFGRYISIQCPLARVKGTPCGALIHQHLWVRHVKEYHHLEIEETIIEW